MKLKGRAISKGEAKGEAIVSKSPVSFFGDINPQNGMIQDPLSELSGMSISGKIFVFPYGRGSTVGSYVLYEMKENSCLPVGLINEKSEVIVATGAIIAGVPLIDGIDTSLLRTHDLVEIMPDGNVGLPNVDSKKAVTAFLLSRGEILILKRSKAVGTQKGKWAGISGYLEEGEKPVDRAVIEIEEETSITDIDLVREGRMIMARADDTVWEVHPFLFKAGTRNVSLDWEHTEFSWINPRELSSYDTVQKLEKALTSVLAQELTISQN